MLFMSGITGAGGASRFTLPQVNLTPQQSQAIWERFDQFDPTSQKMSADLIALLPLGSFLERTVEGQVEPLQQIIKHTRTDRTVDHNFLAHAHRLGFVPGGMTYEQFCERGIIEIYSEAHGGHSFVFDVPSGLRLYPQDVQNIDAGAGDRIAGVNRLLDIIVGKNS